MRLDDRAAGTFVEFSHPLTRAAIYEAMPQARRSALNAAAARLVDDPAAAMRHRVEAATVADAALLAELEAHAHDEMARGAWSSAVSSFLAASRLSPVQAERERLALEAIEAMMYSGDGAAARRLAEQTDFADGPRRDSVLAYLAIFAGDLDAAAAAARRGHGTAARSPATTGSRRRSRSAARSWPPRACAAARRSSGRSARSRSHPSDPANGLLARAVARARAELPRPPTTTRMPRSTAGSTIPRRRASGRGFVLLALKGFLLLADGDLAAARAAFETSARAEPRRGPARRGGAVARRAHPRRVPGGRWDSAVVVGASGRSRSRSSPRIAG